MLRAVYKAIQCRTLVYPVPTSYKFGKVGATPAIKVLLSQQFLSKTIFHTNEAKVALIHRCRGPIPSTLIHRYCTDNMADNRYAADYAKLGTSGCKKCKQKLPKGSLRIAKLVANPFSEEGGDMKQYHHAKCMFETFMRARATTKIIEEPSDLEGYADLEQEDKDMIKELIKDTLAKKGSPKKKTVQSKLPVTPSKKTLATSTESPKAAASPKLAAPPSPGPSGGDSSSDLAARDNSFRQFRRLCADVAEESSNNGKTALVARYVAKGNSGDGFHGDTYLLFKHLLPGVVKTVYNLNDKQLAKIFSQIFGASHSAMVEDLENGDVAETVKKFFEPSKLLTPLKKSNLTLQQSPEDQIAALTGLRAPFQVDYYLTELAKYTKEDDQQTVLSSIAKKCTSNDLKMVIRLIKHDLRINAGARIILDGLDPNAYPAFQASRDLRDVVDRVLANKQEASGKPGMSKKLSVRANLMTPVLPMLAEACKSVEYAMKKCPNGMYAEIKYDGERVQVHKKGDHFEYYSRSLKPVLPHKVQHFKDHIPKAFPHGNDLILDSEVLLIDTKTSTPLPFGTLGVHKKQAFKDANVCLFIFDCLHYNGQNLMDKPIKERRKFLRENMTEVPNRILFSEMKHIREPGDLGELMMKVFREGLEGLVLKDVNHYVQDVQYVLQSVYEPGKRHWLKVKKDYLAEGAMADTADLVVLGAYFGTGNKGGMKSIFLMGCYNADKDHWVTVSKCGSGFDDATLEKLQSSIEMVKISKDYTRIPKWLHMNKSLVPDFVVKDPKKSVVWEITGAEFSKSESHTADGISIRFPRCTKMRDDKSWEEATDLARLKVLYKKSKEHSDLPDVLGGGSKGGPFKKKSKPKEEAMEVDDDSSNGKDMNGAVASPAKTSKSPAKRPAKDTPTKVTPTKKPKVTEASSTQAASPSKKLPDVFKGMKIYVPESVENYKQLKRFIIAFDGDMVPEFEKSSATHIILENGEGTSSSSQETVTTEWLWKCIKKKKLVPFKKGQ